MKISPASHFKGTVRVPGDKSISHRALIFGALADGITTVAGLSEGEDVRSTEQCLRQLGVDIQRSDSTTTIRGVGTRGFDAPESPLDCGNSGTSVRLLMGCLAGQSFPTTLEGDASLSARPMGRIANPLREMGASIDQDQLPLTIKGGALQPAHYVLPIASAQIKSALLLAGLFADGDTKLSGRLDSRDHTERMLRQMGVELQVSSEEIVMAGGQRPRGCDLKVPGDPSAAAFWAAAVAIVPGAQVTIENVSLNPTRIAFFEVLQEMGLDIEYAQGPETSAEPTGTITCRHAPLRGITLDESRVPHLIDELPLIGVLGAYAEGTTTVSGAQELRVKESDRIASLCSNLNAMGASILERPDGFEIAGPQQLTGGHIDPCHDHRIAMAFAIAALGAAGETTIANAEIADVSYPGFYTILRSFYE